MTNTTGRIGVGIIGVTPGRSWAAIAHIPALQALQDTYEIVALSNSRQDSADAAAAEFGIATAFADHRRLVEHPDVDLVVVTVKVPTHRELVDAAVASGKHVLCEWPLGTSLRDAEDMAAAAKQRGIHTAIGLQARSAPAFNFVHDLVRDGYVGEVLSSTLVGSGMVLAPRIPAANAYSADKRTGANLLTIPFGHTLDVVTHILGDLTDVTAILANRRRSFIVEETDEVCPMTAEDQVAVSGVFAGGAVLSAHYRGGMTRGATDFLWEINGTEGDLTMTGFCGLAQMFDVSIRGATRGQRTVEELAIPSRYTTITSPSPFAINVGQAYQRLAADLRDGTRTCPTFDDAVRLHRTLDAIERSAATGGRMTIA